MSKDSQLGSIFGRLKLKKCSNKLFDFNLIWKEIYGFWEFQIEWNVLCLQEWIQYFVWNENYWFLQWKIFCTRLTVVGILLCTLFRCLSAVSETTSQRCLVLWRKDVDVVKVILTTNFKLLYVTIKLQKLFHETTTDSDFSLKTGVLSACFRSRFCICSILKLYSIYTIHKIFFYAQYLIAIFFSI